MKYTTPLLFGSSFHYLTVLVLKKNKRDYQMIRAPYLFTFFSFGRKNFFKTAAHRAEHDTALTFWWMISSANRLVLAVKDEVGQTDLFLL